MGSGIHFIVDDESVKHAMKIFVTDHDHVTDGNSGEWWVRVGKM